MLTTLNTLSSTLRVFKEFTQEPDVQIQALETFLAVASSGNLGLNEVASRIGLSSGAASRNVRKLSDAPRGQEGYGLITVALDPMDHRKRLISLTVRGHELIRHIEEAMLSPLRSHIMRELITG